MANEEKKCQRCSHVWVPRVQYPMACPSCKSYLWDKRRK